MFIFKLMSFNIILWLLIIIVNGIYYRPSETVQCANFCLPQQGKILEQYKDVNGMDYKRYKYCLCQ